MKTRAHSCRKLHSSIPQLCSRLMMPVSVAWSCTGAPGHRVDGLGDHLDVLQFLEHAGRHRAGHPDLELHSRHVFDSTPRRSRPVHATVPPHGGGRIIRTGWESGPEPMSGLPLPVGSPGGARALRGVVSAAEQGEPSMGDQVPGRLRLRRRRRLFLRVRAPSSAADRGCSRPGDPGQRRSRLRVLGASRRGAVAGRVGRSCWGTPKHVRPEHLWRWTRPTTTCRRAGSWCWAR